MVLLTWYADQIRVETYDSHLHHKTVTAFVLDVRRPDGSPDQGRHIRLLLSRLDLRKFYRQLKSHLQAHGTPKMRPFATPKPTPSIDCEARKSVMPTICIQCALKAILAKEPVPNFSTSVEEHMRLYHPDPVQTTQERKVLSREIGRRFFSLRPKDDTKVL